MTPTTSPHYFTHYLTIGAGSDPHHFSPIGKWGVSVGGIPTPTQVGGVPSP